MSTVLTVLQPELKYSKLIGRPIDNTALALYMSCPKKYQYAMVEHRRKKGPPTPAIAYGSGWHHCMEAHFKAPVMPEQELIETVQVALAMKWEDHQQPNDHRTFHRLFLEYKKWLKKNGLPWDEDAKTVGWPENPMVEIATELHIPGARHPYAGKLDRIYTVRGQHFVEDHKTTSRFDKHYFRQYELDNQMMGYATMARLITGETIAGVRINLHVIHTNDSIFERRTIPFSGPRLDHWQRNYDYWLDRLETDHMWFQQGLPGAFPNNFSACAGKYGQCQYAGVCSLPEHLRQRALEEDFIINPWNPLEVVGEEEL